MRLLLLSRRHVRTKPFRELSVRMGFAFSVVALATLTGNPMAGAILGVGQEGRQNLTWWAAIVFAGVRVDMSTCIPQRFASDMLVLAMRYCGTVVYDSIAHCVLSQ